MNNIRSQKEILSRFRVAGDGLFCQQQDLKEFLDYQIFVDENLIEEVPKVLIKKRKIWKRKNRTDAVRYIFDHLPVAYQELEKSKANKDYLINKPSIESFRSLYHFQTWIWLSEDRFYRTIESLSNNYTVISHHILDRISEHYNNVYEKVEPGEI